MIKFAAEQKSGRRLLGFGLSAVNLVRLAQGKPIHLNLEGMGLPNYDVVIMAGETEESMAAELKQYNGKWQPSSKS